MTEEEFLKKLDIAVDRMLAGHSMSIARFGLGVQANHIRFYLMGESQFMFLESIQKRETVKNEFDEMKEEFIQLASKSEKFMKNIGFNKMDYYLAISYGGVAALLCGEEEGVFRMIIDPETNKKIN